MKNLAPQTLLVQMTVEQFEERLAQAVAANDPPSDIVDQTGLAQYLGISLPTLRGLISEGLPFVMCGAHRRFSRKETWEWMRAREMAK